jgi:hypothetical protein
MQTSPNSNIVEMEAVVRLLRLALPLADKSDSPAAAAMIDAAIDASVRRLSELKAA